MSEPALPGARRRAGIDVVVGSVIVLALLVTGAIYAFRSEDVSPVQSVRLDGGGTFTSLPSDIRIRVLRTVPSAVALAVQDVYPGAHVMRAQTSVSTSGGTDTLLSRFVTFESPDVAIDIIVAPGNIGALPSSPGSATATHQSGRFYVRVAVSSSTGGAVNQADAERLAADPRLLDL
jgi:hypothetical protein